MAFLASLVELYLHTQVLFSCLDEVNGDTHMLSSSRSVGLLHTLVRGGADCMVRLTAQPAFCDVIITTKLVGCVCLFCFLDSFSIISKIQVSRAVAKQWSKNTEDL